MRTRLAKRHVNADGTHSGKRWMWIARTENRADTIGFWCESRDSWRPRKWKGRELPRLTKSEAHDRLLELESQMARGRSDRPVRTDWDVFVHNAIEHIRGTVRMASVLETDNALRVFGALVAPKSPRHIGVPMVKRFIQQVKASGRADATANKYLAHLRLVWNSEFPSCPNPFKATRSERQGGIRRFKVTSKRWERLRPDDLQKLLRAAGKDDRHRAKRWQAMILLAYTAAMRSGEIQNLIWTDVDLDSMTLGVNPKPESPATWLWSPKDHERRTLPLTAETKMAILRLMPSDPSHPYVVVSDERYARIQATRQRGRWRETSSVLNNFLREFHTRCRQAELTEMDFHALRKTCITNWAESGVPLHEVQQLAGHSSIETTRRFYLKVDRSAVDRAREAAQRYTVGAAACLLSPASAG